MKATIPQMKASEFLYPLEAIVDGRTYSQWAIEYWNEFIGQQTRHNSNPCEEPLLGGDCFTLGRRDSVIFLPSLFSPHAPSYHCTFDTTNSFFFPLFSEESDYSHLSSDDQLQESVNEHNNYATGHLFIDGIELTNVLEYRFTTEFFNLTFSNLNPFNAKPGTYRALINGLFIFIKPLPIGEHVLTYSVSQNPLSFNHHYSSKIQFKVTIT